MKYRLDELLDLQMGKTPARNNFEYWNTRGNKWGEGRVMSIH